MVQAEQEPGRKYHHHQNFEVTVQKQRSVELSKKVLQPTFTERLHILLVLHADTRDTIDSSGLNEIRD